MLFIHAPLQLFDFRREPSFLVKPSKGGADDERYAKEVAEKKPKATRNLILIRHGQYNLAGKQDIERYLTDKGKFLLNLVLLFMVFVLLFRSTKPCSLNIFALNRYTASKGHRRQACCTEHAI